MATSRYDNSQRIRGRKLMERRALWFMQHPLCVMCKREGRVTLATELDHITALANGGKDDETNLQGLCEDHHRIKTNADLGYKPVRTVGVDGVPEGWT